MLAGIVELLRHPCALRLRHQLLRALDRTRHAFLARRQFELGAVGEHQAAALDRHAVGHHQHQLIAFDRSDHCQADASVARGRLNDRSIALELAARFGGFDHR